jgi:hypothetical protein
LKQQREVRPVYIEDLIEQAVRRKLGLKPINDNEAKSEAEQPPTAPHSPPSKL